MTRLLAVVATLLLAMLVSEPAAPAVTSRVTLKTFAGYWGGHSRSLNITRTGRAYEEISSGCCHYVIKLRFQLSHPRGTLLRAFATAKVTWVHVYDRSDFSKRYPAPRMAQVGTISLRNGIIEEPLAGAWYCDGKAQTQGKCGA